MQQLEILHVGAGSVAVLGMLVAWITRKGSRNHRLAGRAFVLGMLVTLSVGLIIALFTANLLLVLIALFTGYLVYTGWRLTKVHDGRFSMLDRLLMFDMLIVGVCMLLFGGYWLINGNPAGVILLFLGLFASGPAIQDLRRKGQWPTGVERVKLHLIRMGAASIATVTAVLVVNIQTDPVYIAWLVPTIIFSPLITWFSMQLRNGKLSTVLTDKRSSNPNEH